jgi:hypothetical protein
MPGNLIELFDSQAEWQSGTLENLDATSTPGVIIPTGDYTKTYDSQVEWNQGSMSSVQSAAGGTIALTPVPQNWKSATVTASSYQDSSRVPAKAFDGDTDTYWLATSSSNEWLKFDYGGTKRTVTKLRIYLDSTDDLQVKNFQLQGSDDGSQWTTLATGRTTLGAYGWQEWDVPSPRQYRYYRLMCLDNHAPASPMIAVREMEFILQAQYPGSGTWLSPWLAHGISSPRSGLVSLRAETPSGTSVTPHVRYSPNGGSTYTQWYDLDDRRMTDLQGTHVQLRLTLTTDDTKQTPVVDRALLLIGKLHRWTSPVIDLAGVDADAILMLATSQTELDVVREVREPFNLNFTRASTAYNPETGEQVAVNEPRYVEGPFEGSQAVLVEEGTQNIIPLNRQKFVGWAAYGGASVTLTQDQVVPEWGATDATRIQISGGSNALKYYYNAGALTGAHSIQFRVKNQGAATLVVFSNTGGRSQQITSGQSVYVKWDNIVGDGVGQIHIQFRTLDAGDSLDFIAWRPMVEVKPYATSFTDGARSPEIATIPTAGVLSHEEGEIETIWIPNQPASGIIDQPTSPCILGLGTYNSNNSLVLWAYRNFASPGSEPSLRLFVKGSTSSGWSAQFTPIESGAGWYTPGQPIHIKLKWKNANTFWVGVNGETYGPYPINDALTGWAGNTVWLGSSQIGSYPNAAYADLRCSSRCRSDAEDLAAYQSGEPLPVDEWTTYKMVGGLWESVGVAFPCSGRQTLQARLTLTKTDSVAQSLDSVALWESVLMWMYDRPDLRVSPPQVTHVTVYVENSEPVVEYTTSIAVEESKKTHIRVPVPEGSSLAYCQQVAEKVLALKSEERLSITCKIPLLTRMRFGESVAVVMPYAGYTRENPYFGVIQKMTHYPLASPPYTEIQIGEYLPEDIEVLLRLYSSQKGGV